MAGSPSFMKRQKELARQERQKEKAAKKQDRSTSKDGKPVLAEGEDPDIAGIVPGPQPAPEWD
jgi:hypothetical protein